MSKLGKAVKDAVKKVTAKKAVKAVEEKKPTISVCKNCDNSGLTCSVCKAGYAVE